MTVTKTGDAAITRTDTASGAIITAMASGCIDLALTMDQESVFIIRHRRSSMHRRRRRASVSFSRPCLFTRERT